MQLMNGVTAAEFVANTVVVDSWKATVARSCDRNQSRLLRVDVMTIEDVYTRRMLFAQRPVNALASLGRSRLGSLKAAEVHFQVSYTQQDYLSNNITSTTQALKSNYVQSVESGAFTTSFAVEVEKRTNESAEITTTVQPSVVKLEPSYKVIETTAAPSYRPTTQPSTGTTTSATLLLNFCRTIHQQFHLF